MLANAADHDLVVLVGDLLDVSSSVPLPAQVSVVLQYLERLAARCPTAVSTGNHDLTGVDDDGERAALWLDAAAALGVATGGAPLVVGDTAVTVCPWWDGPVGRARIEAELAAQAADRQARGTAETSRWIWAYHWPPPDLGVSWVGTKSYGDADLAGWVERFSPDLVLSGHVHQSPWIDGGSWISSLGPTWIVNAGRQIGPVPSHAVIDLETWAATWRSQEGTVEQSLRAPAPFAQ